jgi:hypothetical protein
LTRGGVEVTLLALANSPIGRADLRFGQDHAGEVYIVTKQDGWIRRMQGGSCGDASCAINGLQYIASYPDLIRSLGANEAAGQQHYLQFGQAEGRIPDLFNEVQYLAKYPDLQAAYGTDTRAATIHYILYGFAEGRTDKA